MSFNDMVSMDKADSFSLSLAKLLTFTTFKSSVLFVFIRRTRVSVATLTTVSKSVYPKYELINTTGNSTFREIEKVPFSSVYAPAFTPCTFTLALSNGRLL
mgnify:CR=1 FL=1